MMSAYDDMTTSGRGPPRLSRGRPSGLSDPRRKGASGAALPALGLRFRFGSPIWRAIPQADFSRLLLKVPLRWRGSLRLQMIRRGSTGQGRPHGFARFYHAPIARGWRAFRPPVAPLEPENGALYLRLAQLDPHHRPRPDRPFAASGAEDSLRHGGQGRAGAVRGHQAPGVGRDCRRGQTFGAVFRQRALARRHVDQLEDDIGFDLAPAQG